MNISILCSSHLHPVNQMLERWIAKHSDINVQLCRTLSELTGGEILFLISCSELVSQKIRSHYKHTLVIHASDLPKGRGWSPYIWEVIAGATEITISLIEANDKVDTGNIWRKVTRNIPSHALYDEINNALFDAEEELMDFAVSNYQSIKPAPQVDDHASYYPKRTPSDSEIDPQRSIADQFDKIRVSDPSRYPAYFEFRGHQYKVTLEKL
ncbi:formyltransferase family protein [Oceanospirillum maris]|uniref:formyltransferase family protein n=1 Tax=Oceanospirillum maris TaxID=64977 RepID=UPI00041532E9|nr:formyltransferase family protein [Oceanospirillum maris]